MEISLMICEENKNAKQLVFLQFLIDLVNRLHPIYAYMLPFGFHTCRVIASGSAHKNLSLDFVAFEVARHPIFFYLSFLRFCL